MKTPRTKEEFEEMESIPVDEFFELLKELSENYQIIE